MNRTRCLTELKNLNIRHKNNATHLILLCSVIFSVSLILITSCNGKTNKTGTADISPDKLLAELPVYPDSQPLIPEKSVFEPFSTPLSPQVEGRPPNVEYETASVWYQVKADTTKILHWYRNKLTGKGYQKYTEMVYLDEDLSRGSSYDIRSMGFYRPDLPEISIEVHVGDIPDNQNFIILVNHEITGAFDPPEPPLPADIDQVTINYVSNTRNFPKQEVITDQGDIRRIVSIINDLSPLPDAPILPVEAIFSMSIHSASQGDIRLYCHMSTDNYPMIRIPDRAGLKDDNFQLLKAVNRLLDMD